MNYFIGVLVGFFICFFTHNFYFKSETECVKKDGIELCRTIHVSEWKLRK